eukprot:scaffold5891_cov121-Isochrysis_galbana.AAC.7
MRAHGAGRGERPGGHGQAMAPHLGHLHPPRPPRAEGFEGRVRVDAVQPLDRLVPHAVHPAKRHTAGERLGRLLERGTDQLALLAPRRVEPDDQQLRAVNPLLQ